MDDLWLDEEEQGMCVRGEIILAVAHLRKRTGCALTPASKVVHDFCAEHGVDLSLEADMKRHPEKFRGCTLRTK